MEFSTLSIVLQGLVVLGCLGLGSRMGGVAVGLFGGIGVLILSAFFRLSPGKFPVEAMAIIFGVVTAVGAMQLAGGIDYLVSIAHRILRSHPKYITYLAPYVSWIFTIGAGTGNVYYSLLPVIEEVAYDHKVRPERPLALSPEGSQLGITSSPVSAAMAIMLTLLAPLHFGLEKILLVVLPSTIVCIFVAAWIQNRRGKELENDAVYQERLRLGNVKAPKLTELKADDISKRAKWSTWIFLFAISIVVFFGFVPELRPQITDSEGKITPMNMTHLITAIMMLGGVVIFILAKVNPGEVSKTNVFQAGMVSILALMGISWMANTFIGAHEELLSSMMVDQVKRSIWILPLAFYVTAALTTSQSTTTLIVVPVAIAMDIPPQYIVASWLAVIGIHFFPASGSQIATIQFDRSGTTRIGAWVLNHSFMIPNLIVASTSVVFGFLMANIFF